MTTHSGSPSPPSRDPLTAYALDGLEPARAVRPTTMEEVVAVVREANERGEAIVPLAGRTRIEVGNAPRRYDTALDLSAMRGIVEHEPADLTATVRAGTTLAELAEHLGRHGQMWPVEVGRPELATVGGVLAGAAAGPSRLAYAHPRDWTVGVRAVLGDGRLTRAGGKVVKNVSGYDLTRLYCGSYGSLCVLVEASLKLWPLPAAERALVARFADPRDTEAALALLRRERVAVSAVATLDRAAAAFVGEESGFVAVRVRGGRDAVARVSDEVARALPAGRPEEARPGLFAEIADVPHRANVTLRVVAPESRMGAALRDAGAGVLRYPGTGIAFLLRDQATAAWVRDRREAAERNEGSCIVERAPRAIRAEVDAWGTPALPLELARRIKAALDPRGVLSPGRAAGGL